MRRLPSLLLLLGLLAAPVSSHAQDLVIEDAWARASIGAAQTGAIFMTLRNPAGQPQKVIAAKSRIAQRAELHEHQMDGSVMRMREVDALEVPPGGSLMLQPGGYHIMLFGLKQPLREGGSFGFTLILEGGQRLTATGKVMPPDHMGDHMGGHMDGSMDMHQSSAN